jgi:hypothetical protein
MSKTRIVTYALEMLPGYEQRPEQNALLLLKETWRLFIGLLAQSKKYPNFP